MISETLFRIENDFRHAVETHAYADVERLVVAFCETAAVEIRLLPKDDPNAEQIIRRVHENLDWSRAILYAARASHQDELRLVPFLQRYLETYNQPAHSRGVDL